MTGANQPHPYTNILNRHTKILNRQRPARRFVTERDATLLFEALAGHSAILCGFSSNAPTSLEPFLNVSVVLCDDRPHLLLDTPGNTLVLFSTLKP